MLTLGVFSPATSQSLPCCNLIPIVPILLGNDRETRALADAAFGRVSIRTPPRSQLSPALFPALVFREIWRFSSKESSRGQNEGSSSIISLSLSAFHPDHAVSQLGAHQWLPQWRGTLEPSVDWVELQHINKELVAPLTPFPCSPSLLLCQSTSNYNTSIL